LAVARQLNSSDTRDCKWCAKTGPSQHKTPLIKLFTIFISNLCKHKVYSTLPKSEDLAMRWPRYPLVSVTSWPVLSHQRQWLVAQHSERRHFIDTTTNAAQLNLWAFVMIGVCHDWRLSWLVDPKPVRRVSNERTYYLPIRHYCRISAVISQNCALLNS